MAKHNIEIRALMTWEEMHSLHELQKDIWADAQEYMIQAPLLASIALNGGSVLGAFDGDTLVGGAVALLGAASLDENRPAMANLKLTSERVLVREAYRNQGIGFHLKLAQYEFASKRGIRLMTWFFDPLSGAYAHITMRKLGAVVSHFYPEIFPQQAERGQNPDRFQADWWLTSGRAVQRLKKKGRSPLTLEQYLGGGTRILNPTRLDDRALPLPSEEFIQPQSALGLIEVPEMPDAIQRSDSGLMQAWRDHTRAIFGTVLSQGFVLTDFVREIHQGRQRSFYVCSHEGALRKFDKSFNQN